MGSPDTQSYLATLRQIKEELQYPDVYDTVKGFASRLVAPITWFANRKQRVAVDILANVNATFKAGSSTLVLGAPGSGKTTLLRAISGRLSLPASLKDSITYNGSNGAAVNAMGLNVRRLVGYAPQLDEHEALLTVRETMQFAHLNSSAPVPQASKTFLEEQSQRVDMLTRILELDVCKDTIVGNDQIRGISGGQKKRVTIAEALLSGARVLALDEITNGLDSSTAYDIVNYINMWARSTGGTVIAALQAPTPEIFASFDNVLLLSEGRVLYQGPTSELQAYLFSVGYARPSYIDTADYAVQVATSPSTTLELYAADTTELSPPKAECKTAEELARAWLNRSKTSGDSTPTKRRFSNISAATRAQFGNSFAQSIFRHFQLLFWRQFKLFSRNIPLIMSKIMQSILMSIIIGTVFLQVDPNNFVMFVSLSLFASIFLAYSNMAEVPVVYQSKRIVHRHLTTKMYPVWSYLVALMTINFPVTFLADVIFCTILYWLVGFADNAGRWVFFVFCGIAMNLCMSSIFRFYAIIAPSQEIAGVFAGAGTGLQLVYGGFLIIKSNLEGYSLPLYYFTPFSWTVRSMSINQFRSDEYSAPISPAPGAPTAGEVYASIFALDNTLDWKLAGPFLCLGYYLVFGILFSGLAFLYMKPKVQPGTRRVPADTLSNGEQTHTALPFTPVSLTFTNINYTVYNPRTKKTLHLLHDVTGYAKPGTMTALMGASGAGKTTLLDVLADRKTSGKVTGERLVNGVQVSAGDFSKLSAYCEQQDIHISTTTVAEALRFSADLRLDPSITAEQKQEFVAWILSVLELQNSANRVVSALAPGESKRLTIGVELAANTPILFLDEPTTGLDSRSAAVVMRVIARIAKSGRTVVATIHQPNAAIFFDFSHLILLAPGGHQVYSGPLGHHARDLIAYLEAVPGVSALPSGINPATWMLEQTRPNRVVTGDAADTPTSPTEIVVVSKGSPSAAALSPDPKNAAETPKLAAYYSASAANTNNTQEVQAINSKAATEAAALVANKVARPGVLSQLRILLDRGLRLTWRDPQGQMIRVWVFLFIALYFGLTYFDIGDTKSQNDALSKLGFMLSGPVFCAIATFNIFLPGMFNARAAFYREKAAGFYVPEAYSVSLILREQPWHVFYSLLFSSIAYFMIGLRADAEGFFTFAFGLYLVLVYYGAMSTWVSGFFPNPQVAQIFGGIIITLLNLFAGINVPVSDIPGGWKWMYYADGVAHVIRLVGLPQFVCNSDNPSGCNLITVVSQGQQTVMSAYEYAESRLSMTYERRWEAAGWVVFIGFIFQLLTVLVYRKVNHQKR